MVGDSGPPELNFKVSFFCFVRSAAVVGHSKSDPKICIRFSPPSSPRGEVGVDGNQTEDGRVKEGRDQFSGVQTTQGIPCLNFPIDPRSLLCSLRGLHKATGFPRNPRGSAGCRWRTPSLPAHCFSPPLLPTRHMGLETRGV